MRSVRYMMVALVCFAGNANAERIFNLAPIRGDSVHGGQVATSGGATAQGCVTADVNVQPSFMMLSQASGAYMGYTYVSDLLSAAYHWVHIDVRNISSIPQVVTVTLNPSTVKSANSNGTSSGGVLGTTWNTYSIPSSPPGYSVSKTIASLQELDIPFQIFCSSASCFIIDVTNNAVAAGTSFNISNCQSDAITCPSQVCIEMQYALNFQMGVTDLLGGTKGAVVAHVTTEAHRINGMVDHYIMPPLALDVNGGRPF